MCCSARPASSGVHSVLLEDRIIRNVMYTGIFCNHKNLLQIFDRLVSLLSTAEVLQRTRLIFFPPALSPCHPPTATIRRWPALPSFPPLMSSSSFGAALMKHCGLPPPSLDGTTVAAVSSGLERRKKNIHFEVNINMNPSIILSDTVGELIPTSEA